MTDTDELLELIEFDDRRGRPGEGPALEARLVRNLTPDDIPALQGAPTLPTASTIQTLRHSHYRLAELLAGGTSSTDAAFIVGYSVGNVNRLMTDPMFKELLAQCGEKREAIFSDTIERMRGLGLRVLEELEAQLEDEGIKWTKRELMEAAELLLLKPRALAPAGKDRPPVQVNLNFVDAGHQPSPSSPARAIDIDYVDLA